MAHISRRSIGGVLLWGLLFSTVGAFAYREWRLDRIGSAALPKELGVEDLDRLTIRMIKIATDNRITADESGMITWASHSAAKEFGYTPHELRGKHINVLMPPRYRTSHGRAYDEAIERARAKTKFPDGTTQLDKISQRACDGLRKDGSEFPIEARMRILEEDGALYGVMTPTPVEAIEK